MLTYKEKWERLKKALETALQAPKKDGKGNHVKYDHDTVLQVLVLMSTIDHSEE